jgi:hypothetical protein
MSASALMIPGCNCCGHETVVCGSCEFQSSYVVTLAGMPTNQQLACPGVGPDDDVGSASGSYRLDACGCMWLWHNITTPGVWGPFCTLRPQNNYTEWWLDFGWSTIVPTGCGFPLGACSFTGAQSDEFPWYQEPVVWYAWESGTVSQCTSPAGLTYVAADPNRDPGGTVTIR